MRKTLLFFMISCGPAFPDSPGSSGASQTNSSTFSDSDSSTSEVSTSSEGFIGFLDTPPVCFGICECDMWAQDCVDKTHKCSPFIVDGKFDSFKCSPGGDVPVGGVCKNSVDSMYDILGYDNCSFGNYCYDIDPITKFGKCFPLCEGSENNPFCSDANKTCVEIISNSLYLCE